MTDPINELDTLLDLRRRLYRALEGQSAECPGTGTAFNPPLDIVRLPDAIEITVELPGVAREAVKVELEGSTLTISGERQAEPDAHFHRRERPCGRFERSLTLRGVSEEDLSASLRDGVLTVRVKRSG